MPQEQESTPIKPDEVVVNQPTVQKGTIQFMNKSGWMNPAPIKVKVITDAIKDFVSGLIVSVGATDIFSGHQAKAMCFGLGIVGLACGVISRATGVKSNNDK
jgi:hypothetical protein